MSRKATCYYFGVICWLVGKNVAQVREHPESALAKLADRHINRLSGDWEDVIKSELAPGELSAARIGQARGIKAREALV